MNDEQTFMSLVDGQYRTHDSLQEAIAYERFHMNGFSNWDGHPLTKPLPREFKLPGLPAINKLFCVEKKILIGEIVLLSVAVVSGLILSL